MRGKLMTLAGAAILALGVSTAPGQAAAATEAHYESRSWPFYGLFGTYDRAALQRGFQVYQEVCAACHGLKRVAFRHLADIGFSEAEVKAIAASHQVTDGPDEAGDMFERPGLPSDHFVSPFANDNAARAANNGALPPDLSLIVKARMGGPDYIYGVLSGY
ncbi:MAG: cytochrome c1, partial [Alphaproteobacteria bacterium]|nr:cytochrome c1 [Alphaproteobacteria bacterium]